MVSKAMLDRYVRASNPFQVDAMYEELAEDISGASMLIKFCWTNSAG